MKKLTPEDIVLAATDRRAVTIPSINAKRMPAAFLIGMPFRLVMRYVSAGVYLYMPKKKPRKQLTAADVSLDHGAYGWNKKTK